MPKTNQNVRQLEMELAYLQKISLLQNKVIALHRRISGVPSGYQNDTPND